MHNKNQFQYISYTILLVSFEQSVLDPRVLLKLWLLCGELHRDDVSVSIKRWLLCADIYTGTQHALRVLQTAKAGGEKETRRGREGEKETER